MLQEVADAHSATPAQIALAWVIRHPAVAAIPGASSVQQVEENAAAAEIVLTDDEFDSLAIASTRCPVTVLDESPRTTSSALRHCARVGKYWSKTVFEDFRIRYFEPSD